MLCTIKTSLYERNLLFPQNKLGREVINAPTAFLFRLSCMMALTLEGYIPMLFGRRMLFMSPLWGEYNLYRFLLIFILILFMPLPTRGRLYHVSLLIVFLQLMLQGYPQHLKTDKVPSYTSSASKNTVPSIKLFTTWTFLSRCTKGLRIMQIQRHIS